MAQVWRDMEAKASAGGALKRTGLDDNMSPGEQAGGEGGEGGGHSAKKSSALCHCNLIFPSLIVG